MKIRRILWYRGLNASDFLLETKLPVLVDPTEPLFVMREKRKTG
jgi:hypothetical protein